MHHLKVGDKVKLHATYFPESLVEYFGAGTITEERGIGRYRVVSQTIPSGVTLSEDSLELLFKNKSMVNK